MCSICKQPKCTPRCPNYISPIPKYVCPICNEGIYAGDEYVDNFSGEFAHLECLGQLSVKDILNWFDIDYRIYEGEQYE